VNYPRQVANVPGKPVSIYDADCRFCVLWIRRWMQITGDAVDYLALQDGRVAQLYPELPREGLETAVHFIEAGGTVFRGAEAVFQLLAANPSWQWPLHLYRRSPLVARTTEGCYRFVAGHRSLFGWLTRLLWGQHVERPDYFLVRRLFLGGLGAIYLAGFLSLWGQIGGLIGEDGILPAVDLMSQARSALDVSGTGIDRYRLLPTLCWLGTSDGFLRFQCAAGALLAVLLMAGIWPRACLALLWVLYLSLTTVGRDFLSFQWDNLLLEAGLLAIFFAPAQLVPRPSREKPAPQTVLWLLRLLLFKLMFMSGVVKLASGSEVWRNLTALAYHYETQPLPTWIGWYAQQLPMWFQKVSCGAMFVVELLVPFLIFAPRCVRMAGGFAVALLQVCILLTGNYTFFNWLTLVLCLLLWDDFALTWLLPRKLTSLYANRAALLPVPRGHPRRCRAVGVAALAVVVAGISAVQILAALGARASWLRPVVRVDRWLGPFRSINSYGLFAVMTTERREIIVQGSQDGREWKDYEFPYKPGDLRRRPAFVAPYQPRLDWQMWFAALGDYRQNPWFVSFCVRLLQGSPAVLGMLAKDPFPNHPPQYVRALVYEYHFTTREERRRTGAWWTRELKGEYLPPISLEMLHIPRQSPGPPGSTHGI